MALERANRCTRCTGADPQSVYENIRQFTGVELVSESHVSIHVFNCSECSQSWLCVWIEVIGWDAGSDSMYESIVPITDTESHELIDQGDKVDIDLIEKIGQNRRWLQKDYYDGEQRAARWVDGHLRFCTPG